MKRYLAVLFITALTAGPAAAQEALIMYAKGQAQVQDVRGARRSAQTGRKVLLNETCLTGKASTLELRAGNDTITLRENTVFKLMAAQKQGQKQNAYSCALGSMNLKIKSVSGVGPRITSGSMSAGVRGTAFEVYAGVDGSSLILVTEGRVEVEAQGSTVFVDPNEGVEVKPGSSPGDKFGFKKPIDYSIWNLEKFKEFEKDPVDAITKIDILTSDYIKTIESLWGKYINQWESYENVWAKWKKIAEDQGEKVGLEYFNNYVLPEGNAAADIFKEIRFNSLSLLSLRRYIVGRMYLFIRTRFLGNEDDREYKNFKQIYGKIINAFNSEFSIERNFGTLLPRKSPFLEEGHI